MYNLATKKIEEGMTEDELIDYLVERPEFNNSTGKQKLSRLEEYGITTDGQYFYWGSEIPLPTFMVDFIERHDDITYIVQNIKNFWVWSQLNPNPESRRMLFEHCRKYDIKITPNGMLIMYRNMSKVDNINEEAIMRMFSVYRQNPDAKVDLDGNIVGNLEVGVKVRDFMANPNDYIQTRMTDAYKGVMNYEIGKIASIPRTECDETQAVCSSGLHLASAEWLKADYFGKVSVVCLVNPMNIVSAPMADGYGKIRCCEFLPVAFAEKEGSQIKPTELEMAAYEYGDVCQAKLIDAVKGDSDEDLFCMTLPNLVSTYKSLTDFEDVHPDRIFVTPQFYHEDDNFWEDEDEVEDDDWDEDDLDEDDDSGF